MIYRRAASPLHAARAAAGSAYCAALAAVALIADHPLMLAAVLVAEVCAAAACDVVASHLRAAGVPAAQSALGTTFDPDTLRVVVGPWSAARTDPAARQVEAGPTASGVYARFDAGGKRLVLLDATGRPRRSLAAGAGLIAATRLGDRAPTWVVAGTDAAGTTAAARAFAEPSALADRFAVAAVSGGVLPVPVGGGT